MKFFTGLCFFSFVIGMFATTYFFFTGSGYLIKSMVLTIVLPVLSIILAMLFSSDTGFLMMNIIIIPLLMLITWKFDILLAGMAMLFVIFWVHCICRSRLKELNSEIKEGIPQIYIKNSREIYVLNGLLPAFFLGYGAYLGYQNGVLGRTSDIISSTGGEGYTWIAMRLAAWPALFIILLSGFFVFFGILRGLLELATLNDNMADLDG